MRQLNILFISPYPPSLIHVRPYNFIRHLSQRGHRITLLALQPPGDKTADTTQLQQWCQSVQFVSLPRRQTLLNGIRAIFSRTPFQAAYSRSRAMAQLIRQSEMQGHFDVVHVEHLRGAEPGLNITQTPLVFDSVDSISLLFEHVLHAGPTWRSRLMARLDLARTRRYEGQLLERFARVLVTSPHDKTALEKLSTVPNAKNRVIVVPNGVDLEYFAPMNTPRDPPTVIFSGKMSYHANVAAALDLVTQVMPLVWQKVPQAKLVIAGKDPAAELVALGTNPHITITGTVPDLRPYLARATVAVSPIRYGVGIQNKVMEAMAMATPVVSTPQALSALQVTVGENVLVARSPEEIAATVVMLLNNPAQSAQVGLAGRRYVEAHHNWNTAAKQLETVYRDVRLAGL